MNRKEFDKRVFDKLSVLNPEVIDISNVIEGAVTIRVISDSFVGLTTLERINVVYDLISDEIEAADFSVIIVALTVDEE